MVRGLLLTLTGDPPALRDVSNLAEPFRGNGSRPRPASCGRTAACRWRGATVGTSQSCTPRVSAPSTTRLVPLTRLAAGLARKTTGAAISSGVPMWPVGFRFVAISKRAGSPVSMLCQTPPSKYVFPGETVLARILLSASWIARHVRNYCRGRRSRTWSARRSDTRVAPSSASVEVTSWSRMSAARATPRSPPAISP